MSLKQDSESLTNETDVMGTVSVLHILPHTIVREHSHESFLLDVVCSTYSKTFTIYYYSLYAFDIADLKTEGGKWPQTADVFLFYTITYG